MNEVENPFADDVARANRSARRSKAGWIVAALMAALSILFIALWTAALARVREAQPLRANLEDANARLTNALAQIEQDKAAATNLAAQLAGLQQEKEAVGDAAKRLEEEMRSGLESRDVTISNLQGKLTVSILDRVMFDSGEAILKPDGEAVMRGIADILGKHPELKIQVIGHTDNVPIRTRFASNWELSTARALAAVHFLTEHAGVDPARVGAAGYGEYRPIADNATPEGRAMNRRIAITILPDELAGADAGPGAQPNSQVNAKADSAGVAAPEPTVK